MYVYIYIYIYACHVPLLLWILFWFSPISNWMQHMHASIPNRDMQTNLWYTLKARWVATWGRSESTEGQYGQLACPTWLESYSDPGRLRLPTLQNTDTQKSQDSVCLILCLLTLRPVHLLRVFLFKVLESNFPGDPLSKFTDMRIPTT